MKLPISWLKEFVPKLPPTPKLVELFMMHGLEVEEVIDQGRMFDHVVVGEIIGVRPHPDADKLRLADVIIEPKGGSLEIVCGAPNIAVGQKVPVALIGAKLPNGMTIAKRAIRGVVSNGMLCAADELGLGKDHSGILVLEPTAIVGDLFAKAYGLDDVVLDLAIPSNRSDLFSVRGLAREVGALLGRKSQIPNSKSQTTKNNIPGSVTVRVDDKKLCSLYQAQIIRGLTVGESPAWLQQRLRASGMRAINNVVDITNSIMLEYGQPLHAFDAAKVVGAIRVRAAQSNETIVTLDNKARPLDPSMLVIADDEGPMAIAGVMGGKRTLVTAETKDIVLESAIFNPVSIRRTSWKLGLQSEASRRFEKGLPVSLPAEAADAAASMFVEICGGTIEAGVTTVGDSKLEAVSIATKLEFIVDRLGMNVSASKIKTILTRLGFKITGAATWKVTVPSWRLDVTQPEDIVDEVGRITGYDELPVTALPTSEKKDIPSFIRFKDEVRNILVELVFTEVVSHAFYGRSAAAGDEPGHFAVANPLDKTQQFLRKSLSPQIVDVLKQQADAGNDAMIFEIGRVFDPSQKNLLDQQPWKLAIGLVQIVPDQLLNTSVNKLLQDLQAEIDVSVEMSKQPVRARRLKYCEIDLTALMTASKKNFGSWDPSRHITLDVHYRELSKYPAIKRDISAFIPNHLGYETIRGAIIQAMGDQVDLLDISKMAARYVKDGKTSITFSLEFRSKEKTLTKEEVDAIMDRLGKTITSLGVSIR